MPSDGRTTQVLAALADRLGVFTSTVATTGEAVRGLLEEFGTTPDLHRAHLAAQFGAFGASYLDAGRVATLLNHNVTANRDVLHAIERALGPLDALAKAETESLVVTLEPGANLYEAVAATLAHVGRAFAAARLVQAARSGDTRLARSSDRLAAFPYGRWNTAERRVAPPIVVEVEGSDVRAAGLTEFLDGQQHIALVVRGPCSPAPLARLISPGTFVVQAKAAEDLGGFRDWSGPAIAALVPDNAALFEYDPRRGGTTVERLTVTRLPDHPPRGTLAGLSAAQQQEELAFLTALTRAPATVPSPGDTGDAAEAAEPADALAAWLLSQADLSSLG